VLGRAQNLGKDTRWFVRCDCGREKIASGGQMRFGTIKTCGRCKNTKEHKREYAIWAGLRQRCLNQNCPAYPRYGGRGITVCERWNDFSNFYADMGSKPEGMELDRINNNGPYSPENCRWTTRKQNTNNRSNNLNFTVGGVTKTLAQWCEETGIGPDTVMTRINRHGWPLEKALTAKRYEQRKQRSQ